MAGTARLARTLTSGVLSEASGRTAIIQTAAGATAQATVADYAFGTSYVYALGAGGTATLVSTTAQATGAHVAVSLPGVSGALPVAALRDAVSAAQAGADSAATAYLDGRPTSAGAVSLLGVTSFAATYVVAAAAAQSGLAVWRVSDDFETLEAAVRVADSDARHLANVSDLALTTVGGNVYVFAASASEHGVTGFRMDASGDLTQVSDLGMLDSVPVRTVTALGAATVDGAAYLVLASAGTSSLTVMRVAADGGLTVVDHVIDDLATRFAGAAHLEVVSTGGRAFVIAAGADDGLTIFAMTAEGRLVHLATLEDAAESALDGVSALSAAVVGGTLTILTRAGSEAGLSLFTMDLSALGAIASAAGGQLSGTAGDDLLALTGSAGGAIRAGAGADILTDGAGADTLYGGAGADVFVLRADGAADTIADVAVGEDRIDLSAWTGLRAAAQASVQTTATGAVLTFGSEKLTLKSAGGLGLSAAQVEMLIAGYGSHVDVVVGPLLFSEPEPVPEAGPIPVAAVSEFSPVADPVASVAQAQALTLTGGPQADLLQGGAAGDRLWGMGGADRIFGAGGADTLYGGAGADTIFGGLGDDAIWGGVGNDLIRGHAGADTIAASAGADKIFGGAGADRLRGEAGADSIFGEGGDDLIFGGAGADSLVGGPGADRIEGAEGPDTLRGGAGSDSLFGGAASDRLYGEGGADVIQGGAGLDMLFGGDGADTLRGGLAADRLSGGAGADNLFGGGGADSLSGGAGPDRLYGEDGADALRGEGGADRLFGGAGADRIWGGAGADTVAGGAGADTLAGEAGPDVLSGGAGADVFLFAGASGARDVIQDFVSGLDHIRIAGLAGQSAADRFAQLSFVAAQDGMIVLWEGGSALVKGLETMTSADFIF